MAQTYFPFDSGNGANLTETQWQKMAQHWLATGVIKSILNELQVYADSTGLQAKVKTGAAWLKGHYFESDAEETLAIGTANSTNPRIDRVVIRLDWTANTIALAVLQGTAAVSPVAPALTQNSSRWEISLAQVRVNAAVSTITSGNITDERNFVKNSNAIKGPLIPFTFQNGWVTQASNWMQGYFIDDSGMVEGWAMIANGTTTNGTVFATMPVGYRPLKDISFPMVSYDTTNGTRGGRISITASTGALAVNENTGSGWVIVYFRYPTF